MTSAHLSHISSHLIYPGAQTNVHKAVWARREATRLVDPTSKPNPGGGADCCYKTSALLVTRHATRRPRTRSRARLRHTNTQLERYCKKGYVCGVLRAAASHGCVCRRAACCIRIFIKVDVSAEKDRRSPLAVGISAKQPLGSPHGRLTFILLYYYNTSQSYFVAIMKQFKCSGPLSPPNCCCGKPHKFNKCTHCNRGRAV